MSSIFLIAGILNLLYLPLMILIKFAVGFEIFLFFALIMAIITRLNNLSEQCERIFTKLLLHAENNEKKLIGQRTGEPAKAYNQVSY
jgi:hypothetical protein